MNNEDKGIKILVSRPFKTFLSWLTGALPLEPTARAYSVPPDPQLHVSVTLAFMTLEKSLRLYRRPNSIPEFGPGHFSPPPPSQDRVNTESFLNYSKNYIR